MTGQERTGLGQGSLDFPGVWGEEKGSFRRLGVTQATCSPQAFLSLPVAPAPWKETESFSQDFAMCAILYPWQLTN